VGGEAQPMAPRPHGPDERESVVDILEALYTARAMHRVEDTLIPTEVQTLDARRGGSRPSDGNSQGWRFLLVDDPGLRS
jgi:hypothetical protein